MKLQLPLDSEQAEKFVLKTDQAPEFWQFLNGLRGDDLLVELIVNELDARSSRTEIRFEPDELVCAGNGDPIDAPGWERLSYIKGAGHEVAAKVGMFGVKNHVPKPAFAPLRPLPGWSQVRRRGRYAIRIFRRQRDAEERAPEAKRSIDHTSPPNWQISKAVRTSTDINDLHTGD